MLRELQNYERKDERIRVEFRKLLKEDPKRVTKNIKFSWSNWVFGQESLVTSVKRLVKAGIKYIELHGNKYSESLGYRTSEVRKILTDNGIAVSGICGMFTPQNDLSSNQGWIRQQAIDYIKRNVELGYELGAEYFLIVPGAVGRPTPIDKYEIDRSIETLERVADMFVETGIKGAIEPIRAAEVSFCHNFKEAVEYIERLNHPGIQWINGDVYHMMQEESHIGETILKHGDRLINIHLADTNRGALGEGMLNLDLVLMSLYLVGYNQRESFVTAEPLRVGADPYAAVYEKPNPGAMDELVQATFHYFIIREKKIKQCRKTQVPLP